MKIGKSLTYIISTLSCFNTFYFKFLNNIKNGLKMGKRHSPHSHYTILVIGHIFGIGVDPRRLPLPFHIRIKKCCRGTLVSSESDVLSPYKDQIRSDQIL